MKIHTKALFYAHSKADSGTENWQLLNTHLCKVAKKAEIFADSFGNGDWAFSAGLFHDLGKYNPEFQTYIRQQCGCDENFESVKTVKKVDHSTAGALFAIEKLKSAGLILSYLISGHHAGLPDWFHEKGVGGNLENRLENKELLEKIRAYIPGQVTENIKIPHSRPVDDDSRSFHLWIRFLYSCLVDADFLDTEDFMNPEKSSLRGQYETLGDLLVKYNSYMAELVVKADDTPVNRLRKSILAECREAGGAGEKSGIFSLTVPTGGGKTLSAMAFALEHAEKYGKNRIIMAIPFTSIIEQTAGVYKKVFGEKNVIEHHSNLDPEKESIKSKLATENWDAPVIVTTNVQLFESLFAARSSGCRKLHNIVNSVIILDEAQTIPADFLKPVLNVLNALVEYFNVTLVLCTATQPALCGRIGSLGNGMEGFQKVREIIRRPAELAAQLNRVSIVYPKNFHEPVEWDVLARELCRYDQVLCIVNTRKDCRELHRLMPENTIHLSATMCAEERSEVIGSIKNRLKKDETIRVISTQLVEAGVDIDFPVVYRALAGLDSIAQAAGRCNREGEMTGLGKMKVFVPPEAAPPGFLRKGQDTTKELLNNHQTPDFSPSTLTKYFELFYSTLNSFDVKNILSQLSDNAHEMKIQFRTVARDFKFIDDSYSQSIIVWYDNEQVNSHKLIEQLKNRGPERWLLRKLQRFGVSVPKLEFQFYRDNGMVEEVHGFWVQSTLLLYQKGLGIVGQNPSWNEELFMC